MAHTWDKVDEEYWDNDRDELWEEIKDEVDMERDEWEYYQNILDLGSTEEDSEANDNDEW